MTPAAPDARQEARHVNLISAIAIFMGAGVGALLRWTLAHQLNAAFPSLPPGTLIANVLGGLLMGMALGAFAHYSSLSPVLRLAFTTGFLGGLTTFSAFSAESAMLLLRGEIRWACLHTAAHVGASLLATLGGFAAVRALLRVLGNPA